MCESISELRGIVERLQAGEDPAVLGSEWCESLVSLRAHINDSARANREVEEETTEHDEELGATWSLLQSVETQKKYVLEEIKERREEEVAMRKTWLNEGLFGDSTPLDVDADDFDAELEKRGAQELKTRESLQARLREMQARKQALLAKRAQERKVLEQLESEVGVLLKSLEGTKADVRESDPPRKIDCAMEMLPLPLRVLYNQFSACNRALGQDIELLIRDKGNREGKATLPDNPYGFKGELVVILRIFDKGSRRVLTAMEFSEKDGLVLVFSPSDRVVLSSLFWGDSGQKLPSGVVPGLKSGNFEASAQDKKTGYPYKWAQLLGAVDVLPKSDEDASNPAVMERVEEGLRLYREDQRVTKFLERVRNHSEALSNFRDGSMKLSTEGGVKQCTDPNTRARLKEFVFLKSLRGSISDPIAKRHKGESGKVSNRFKVYKATLECEGVELHAQVHFPMTDPERPLFLINSIGIDKSHRSLSECSIEGARKWIGAQLSSSEPEVCNTVDHMRDLVATFGAWVGTMSGPPRPTPFPTGRARAVHLPHTSSRKRHRNSV
ncbi:hypothetical protein BSKO_04884 [Bryopsis sp. KO-2023]|nr:hypothetical protein BSKO_04884 [Bryopsis sp. KO-2023]